MSFKTTSFISIANRGLNPTISSSLTRRVVNPSWRFNRTVVVTFKQSGTWTCPAGVTSVEYLVLAGGGGGQRRGDGGVSGGGGAGDAVSEGRRLTPERAVGRVPQRR